MKVNFLKPYIFICQGKKKTPTRLEETEKDTKTVPDTEY